MPKIHAKGNRTVFIYMAAQNSLGSDWSHNQKNDSIEIMKGRQYVSDDNRLLFFIDDAANPRIYQVTRQTSQPELVMRWDTDRNSTSPDFLKEVLTWVKTYYPANEFGLIMWSHADGWIPSTNKQYSRQISTASFAAPYSFGIDDGKDMGSDNGSQMDITDMADAISGAGIHAKYIFFDACLMQNLEVAYALKDVTDYIVGAPIATPAAGANYTHQLQNGFFSDNPSDIAATYKADISDPAQVNDYSDFGIVISAIRTDKLQAVADALNAALPYSSLMGRRSPDMEGVLKYQAYSKTYYYRPHNYDAAESLRSILPQDKQDEVLAALDEAVVYKAATSQFWIGPYSWGTDAYEKVNLETYSGVSIFIPQQIYTENAASCSHSDHNVNFQSTAWYKACNWKQTGW